MADQNNIEPMLQPLRSEVLNAVKIMFDRVAADQQLRDNVDTKETLTDCEFGMILLLVHRWFRQESKESEFLALINSTELQRVVISLVKRVTGRITHRTQDQDGGEGNGFCFFTGEPYTKYEKKNVPRYSAHLDAAMITLAFLAPAVEQFNPQLVELKSDSNVEGLPDWINNLRDLALFVILDGLSYAKDCQVKHNNKFLGFTSDPESNHFNPETGGLEADREAGLDRDHDRLFFTWTACETINDIKSWRKSYLDQRLAQPPPEKAASDLRTVIDELDPMLITAADWCEQRFFPEFEKFKIEDLRELVRQVDAKKGGVLGDQLEQRIEEVRVSVQHVYHFSQYAAIRSLVPTQLSLKEVETIVDKLDRLVTTSIMNSLLDESKQPDLFRTLTRGYSLGKSNRNDYPDDAWYPLVVRSLSGLLARTLSDFVGRYPRSEVEKVSLRFQRSLELHVTNLLARRAEKNNPGDDELWSFASNQPYVLYATQRTIFALLQYADFVKEVDRFQTERPASDKLEEDLALMAGRKFADSYFLPLIREMRLQLEAKMASANAQPSSQSEVQLPEESWAAPVVSNTLARLIALNDDFKESRVDQILPQRVGHLTLLRDTVINNPSEEGMPKKKAEALQVCKGRWEEILQLGETGQKLSQLENWEAKEVTRILFEDLLMEYLKRPNESFSELLGDEKPSELLRLIERGRSNQEDFKRK